ncbi:hypothetical protein GIB67_027998 [Kingdonia uniflora]|uniref:Uncharacterized protein n=1 Tax=Kingdonia uniflora TaxID=39325 RepID=A0A7J7L707_9MAGN|nr:hypothetical protein GIB67_027998 [Kingdonia uniflora]
MILEVKFLLQIMPPISFTWQKRLEQNLKSWILTSLTSWMARQEKLEDMKVAGDYLSVISLTLKLQDEAKNSGRIGVIGVHSMSEIAFVQNMPYAYIHEFTGNSVAEVCCSTEVMAIRRSSTDVTVYANKAEGDIEFLIFDKILNSGALPFKIGKTYRSPSIISAVLTSVETTVLMEMNDPGKELFSKITTSRF